MATESQGKRIFRTALLAESAINLTSILPALFAPDWVLSCLVKPPAQSTPLAKSLVQWSAALLTLATAPLLLSYPNPVNSFSVAEREAVTAKRRLTYAIMGLCEIVLASTTGWQWLSGSDTGMKDSALLMATASVGGFGLVRGWVMFAKPKWMEPPAGTAKKG